MAYQINKTDGTVVAMVPDGQIDELSTDLTLIGKNYSGFGEALNENFIKLLENFADVRRPINAIRGQLWYDTADDNLKVFNGTAFVPVSAVQTGTQQPAGLGVGDLWYDTGKRQLFYWTGSSSVVLGPAYSANQGRSGFEVQTVVDVTNIPHSVVMLYAGSELLGLFSRSEFTPRTPIVGFGSKTVVAGFNIGQRSDIRFDVTSTNAEQLGGYADYLYLRSDLKNRVERQFAVGSDSGLTIGSADNAATYIEGGDWVFEGRSQNQNIEVKVRQDTALQTAIRVDAATQRVYLYPGAATSRVVVDGDLEVKGNLIAGTIRPLVLSLDVSDGSDSAYIADVVLETLAPVSQFDNGTIARILCFDTVSAAPEIVRTVQIFELELGKWIHQETLEV